MCGVWCDGGRLFVFWDWWWVVRNPPLTREFVLAGVLVFMDLEVLERGGWP